MGLDITAYSKLKLVEGVSRDDAEDRGLFLAYVNDDFPGRENQIKHRASYSYGNVHRFRAGSYGGYNQWREQLAQLAGYPPVTDEDNKPHSQGAWRSSGGPFWELIHFADNEGVIGAEHAAKLAKDFQDYQERADAIGGYFAAKYADWRTAFEIAADAGAVDFH